MIKIKEFSSNQRKSNLLKDYQTNLKSIRENNSIKSMTFHGKQKSFMNTTISTNLPHANTLIESPNASKNFTLKTKLENSLESFIEKDKSKILKKIEMNNSKIQSNKIPFFLKNSNYTIEQRMKLRQIKKSIDRSTPSKFADLFKNQSISDEFNPIIKDQTVPIFKLKNFNFIKSGGKMKNISHGSQTIFLKNIENKNIFVEKMHNLRKDIPESIKNAIRWKNLKWIIMNNKDEIDCLIKCYKKVKSFLVSNNHTLNRETFSEIMNLILKGNNEDFIKNIFFLFDEEEKNEIDLKEMVIGLEIFRNDSYITKMEIFIDLCDENDDGMIDVNEFKRILKKYLFDKRDLKIMPQIIHEFVNSKNFQKTNQEMSRNEFFEFMLNNEILKELILRNIENIKKWDLKFENQILSYCMMNLEKSKLTTLSNIDNNLRPSRVKKISGILDIIDFGNRKRKDYKNLLIN